MFRSRTSWHAIALWLALSAVVLRSLIPVGFMPGWTGSSGGESASWLIICPASPLSAALAPKASSHAGHPHHDHAAMLAAMAAATSTGNGDPHAGHHAGMHHDAATMSVAAVDPHAGHDMSAMPGMDHSQHAMAAGQPRAKTYRMLTMFGDVLDTVEHQYVTEVDDTKLIEAALRDRICEGDVQIAGAVRDRAHHVIALRVLEQLGDLAEQELIRARGDERQVEREVRVVERHDASMAGGEASVRVVDVRRELGIVRDGEVIVASSCVR